MPLSRLYIPVLKDHFSRHRQMAFLTGPRQVGKTTMAKALADHYLNYDLTKDRQAMADPAAWQDGLTQWRSGLPKEPRPILALDELHKRSRWKDLLKSVFDGFEPDLGVLVTGSARLDLLRRGGDSLMGRYFLWHIHPFTAGELLHGRPPAKLFHAPSLLDEERWQALRRHGGYPEPLTAANDDFTRQWQQRRREQLLKEDLRDLTRIRLLDQVERLMLLLDQRSATTLSYSNLAQDLETSPVSVRQWIQALLLQHQGFVLTPYTRKIARSLSREPKWYSRDWSSVEDPGQRFETMVACHLLKSVDLWTDQGLGSFKLHYLRNRQHQEVDFLILRDNKPWLLAEAKCSDTKLSPNLAKFQAVLGAPHAIQVVEDLPFTPLDFERLNRPSAVPARAFLSQLS